MSKFSLEQLTEGIRQRHLGSHNRQLVEKWSRTGLLRGLEGQNREVMSTLLENQAAQLLRERSTLGNGGGAMVDSGDMSGFQNVAFPIVRRVFGGLVANELVSIQPMSLPSGLLFYLDYTYGSSVGGAAASGGAQYASGSSFYGSPAGKGIRSGSLAVGGQYDLAGSGYSRVYAQASDDSDVVANELTNVDSFLMASGAFGAGNTLTSMTPLVALRATGSDGKLLMFDPQITAAIEDSAHPGGNQSNASYYALFVRAGMLSSSNAVIDSSMVKDIGLFRNNNEDPATGFKAISSDIQGGAGVLNVRRLNELGTFSGGVFTPNALASLTGATTVVKMIVSGTTNGSAGGVDDGGSATAVGTSNYTYSFAVADRRAGVDDGASLTIPAFESDFGATPSPEIPEIDIKVESIAVTAQTRKLRARWSPELAQDLNAYHSLDAEVELTQILSEQIALEIDREILNDLVTQADTRFYWSRSPGDFINKRTAVADTGASFTGTVREWYETLVETIIDVGNEIHRKTLRGSANFIVVSPEVATILEASVMYRPSYSLDGDGQVQTPFSIGAEKVGTLSNRFTVYKDPYFPRNQVLVGYKGGSYLETGYVYAPYVPLIVTPTIFAPEDFTPRKGVMTRYGKKMVRNDFYGTVTCLNMDII